MKNPIRFFQVLFVCLVIINQSAFAQPIQENASMVNRQSEFLPSPIYLNTNSTTNVHIDINAEILKPKSRKYDADENAPANETLPAISDMLNRDAQAQAVSSFESLRRNSIFQVETSLVSRFLAFTTARESA